MPFKELGPAPTPTWPADSVAKAANGGQLSRDESQASAAADAVFEAWLDRKPIPGWVCPGVQPHSPSLTDLPGLIANHED